MKKLLGILGTITITGSGMLGIIGNTPISVKTEINYLQTNNSEKVIRVKRAKDKKCSITNNTSNKGIVTPRLTISSENNNYNDNIDNIISFLTQNNILTTFFESSSNDFRTHAINSSSEYNYFIIPINIEGQGEIALVFRTSDLYLQGFIQQTTHNWVFKDSGIFYFFKDSTVKDINVKLQLNNQTISITNQELNISSDYGSLISGNPEISWTNIVSAFETLFNYNNTSINVLKGALARVIFATAENMRFGKISDLITKSNKEKIYWEKDIKPIVTNWSKETKKIIGLINEVERKLGKKSVPSISEYMNMPIQQLVKELKAIDIKTLLLIIAFSYCNMYNEYNIRNKRDLEETCHIDNYLTYDYYDEGAIFERKSTFLPFAWSNSLKLKLTYVMWEKINILKQVYGLNSNKFKEKLQKIIANFPQNNPTTDRYEGDIDSMTEKIIEKYDEINQEHKKSNPKTTKFLVVHTGSDKEPFDIWWYDYSGNSVSRDEL